MSLQRAYVLLAGLYSLLPVIGIVAVFSGGGAPLAGTSDGGGAPLSEKARADFRARAGAPRRHA